MGANGLGDQYEMPLGQLNLILRGEIGERWQANSPSATSPTQYRIEQENREGTAILNSYRMGMNVLRRGLPIPDDRRTHERPVRVDRLRSGAVNTG